MAVYRFSDYQFNSDTRELICLGETVRLRRKVSEVLAILIQQRERAVTKEELLDQVWEQGEFRENSLLQCIRELRKHFKDSAQSPQFIQTVHRLGYQWIFLPVEEISAEQVKRTSQEQNNVVPEEAKGARSFTSQKTLNTIFGLVLMGLVLLVVSQWERDQVDNEAELEGAIAVLPFVNNTGEEQLQWLELGFADMFSHSLARASGLAVVPSIKVQQAIASLPHQGPLDEQAVTLLREKQLSAVITMLVEKEDEVFRFTYSLHSRDNKKITGELSYLQLGASLNAMVASFLEHLDLLGFRANHSDSALALALSDESAALQAYASGIQALRSRGARLARHYFEAALLHDEQFSMAKIKLAHVLFLLGEWGKSESLYHSLLDNEQIQKDRQLMAEVLFGLGDVSRELNHLSQAQRYLSQALSKAQEAKRPYLQADVLRSLSLLYGQKGDRDKRHQYLLQADALSRPFQSPYMEAESLYYLGSPSNQGLEVDANINMEKNKLRLERALRYYQKVQDAPGEAMTLLAIGQNYLFDLPYRESALLTAEDKFRALGNIASLVDTLNYHAYFYIQLHLGDRALPLLDEAKQILSRLPSEPRQDFVELFRALALLDIGTDRGYGAFDEHLNMAADAFTAYIERRELSCQVSMVADAHLLLAWAYIELGEIDRVVPLIDFAKQCYTREAFPVSLRYTMNTLMDVFVQKAQWHSVISLAKEIEKDYLNTQYLARAHFELGDVGKAVDIMEQSKLQFGEYWQNDSEQKLEVYRRASIQQAQKLPWEKERSSRLVYCDDLWNHEGLEDVLRESSNKK